ncbi:biotin--[acetyl-CoA-carboxylase] ligase [Pacificispira spongiicola]|uniref:biotin--[acetyl-CoA-carboxylase] ligase n=1 Tax=Pacificispira spongiicola TaxID=2729598 RepID=UPI0029CAA6D6|nr:biotin--[acetyl-CoA-carboxylase] ligase [Pacificispira spongiicola]
MTDISLPQGWTGHVFDEIGSTMDVARALANDGAPDRTAVRAVRQTGGRGRYGRHWVAEPGNLYVTALFREDRPLADCAQLSFAAALALLDCVETPQSRLKWPNDVLIGGKKVAGILLEGGGEPSAPWILIGIGVNCVHHPEDGTTYKATDLAAQGIDLPADRLYPMLLSRLDHWRGVWKTEGPSALHRAWTDAAANIGETIRVRLSDREISGRFDGLDDSGALILAEPDGTMHKISAGDVFLR